MRISEWSSDVCSSDLDVDDAIVLDHVELLEARVVSDRLCGIGIADDNETVHVEKIQSFGGDRRVELTVHQGLDRGSRFESETAENPSAEIGRASCRERVCQYV